MPLLDPLPGPPRHVGPYRLLSRIGAGGMGEVFLAREPRPGAPLVAVKTVREGLDLDDGFRVRFRREIAAARAVTGAGTAALVGGDADAEVPWLATEFVPGPSLAETVARCGPLPVDAVRALGAGLARALGAVHAAEVLHRDLKPANVLLTADGPKLIDFGIAQAFDATALTSTGVIVGTPGFLAPEQVEGSHAVVPRSDVFSLGAVLCFAATGRGPFDDEEVASVIFRIVQGDADLSRVPAELREPIAECLRVAPGERPTPDALARRLAEGDAPVPWPAPVLSLFAEHREAVDRRRQDLERASFAAAETSTEGAPRLVVPPSPTAHDLPRPVAPGTPPAALTSPVASGAGRRRAWPWITAAAAAGVAVALAAVYLPGLRGDDGPDLADGGVGSSAGSSGGSSGGGGAGDSGGAGGAGGTSPKRPATPAVTSWYGNASHNGEFGASATDAGGRPAGWKPWTKPKPRGLDDLGRGCVLVKRALVCRDGTGAATALDASTGAHKWTSEGLDGDLQNIRQETPPDSDGQRVFVPSALGTTAVDAASGRVLWRHRLPANRGLVNLTYAKGVVYTVELNLDIDPQDDSDPAVLSAHRASDGHRLWRKRMRKPQPLVPLLVRNDTVYVPFEGGGVTALAADDGSPRAKSAGTDCDTLIGYRSSVVCWSSTEAGVRELDPASLRTKRTLAGGRTPLLPPVVGDAGVLVVTTANPDRTLSSMQRLIGYDWATGKELWDRPAAQEVRAVALSGRRVLSVGAYDIKGMALTGDADSVRTKDLPTDGNPDGTDAFPELSPPLYAGGAMYVQTADGGIISGYTP
ncbi:PQQ-binding-like beta-propeller repeat protein [Streptomyces sp. NPDC059063]|uniref:serine/threonine-protein kinase n=1 Tax=unclassified Streptomyces TaxID=2593676 RepID=UPI0036BD5978